MIKFTHGKQLRSKEVEIMLFSRKSILAFFGVSNYCTAEKCYDFDILRRWHRKESTNCFRAITSLAVIIIYNLS